MIETQTEEPTSDQKNVEEPVETTEAAALPVAEEKTPMDLILDELDAMKRRIAQLESVAHSGHELNEHAVAHIASVVVAHINNGISTAIQKRLG